MTSSATSISPWVRRAPWYGAAVVPSGIILALLYANGLSLAAFFLCAGWVSLVAAASQLWKAAVAIDDPTADMDAAVDGDRRVELEREKKLLLKAIKEVEFDHAMGKIDDADAQFVTAGYRARALEILQLLDEDKGKGPDYSKTIDKELARRVAKAGIEAKPAEKQLEAPKAQAAEAVATPRGVCVSCTTPNDEDAVFCKKCGARMAGA
jgi:hypothetical protein